jgi:hypothetical protein
VFSQEIQYDKIESTKDSDKLKPSYDNPNGKGSIMIDLYIGFPNWGNPFWSKNFPTDPYFINYKFVGGFHSLGGRVEYMISENLGVGADVNYEVSGNSFSFIAPAHDENGAQLFEPNGDWVMETYTKIVKVKNLRAMFRLNYHYVLSDKMNLYLGLAAGYKNINRSIELTPFSPSYIGYFSQPLPIPFTGRIAVGIKGYFTKNIGAHLELGAFGGGLIQTGLSVTF